MAYEQKDGQGSLFRNKEKENESHADYTGSIKIAGVEFWLNAWLKTSKAGAKYMSLSAKPKKTPSAAPAKAPAADLDDGSDIPF